MKGFIDGDIISKIVEYIEKNKEDFSKPMNQYVKAENASISQYVYFTDKDGQTWKIVAKIKKVEQLL